MINPMKLHTVSAKSISEQSPLTDWYRLVSTICILLSLTACAAQLVELPQDFWQGSAKSVGIIFVKPPAMDAHRRGGQGLLGVVINESVTDSVSKHLASLNFETLEKSRSQIKAHIEARGSTAIVIPKYYEASDAYLLPKEKRPKGHFDYDLSSIRDQYAINYLLMIQVYAAGSIRDYYRFIPTSDPSGYINATVTIVDLSDNGIVFNERIVEEVRVEEGLEWDDPDNGYPALTSAVQKALENAGTTLAQKL
jgi:hypothetical protein